MIGRWFFRWLHYCCKKTFFSIIECHYLENTPQLKKYILHDNLSLLLKIDQWIADEISRDNTQALFSFNSRNDTFALMYWIHDFFFLNSFRIEANLKIFFLNSFQRFLDPVSLSNSISTFVGYFWPKQSLKNSKLMVGGNKGVHAFPKGISREVTVIERLELELTYYNVAVNHNATSNPPFKCFNI